VPDARQQGNDGSGAASGRQDAKPRLTGDKDKMGTDKMAKKKSKKHKKDKMDKMDKMDEQNK
jgi:hypothetical protein